MEGYFMASIDVIMDAFLAAQKERLKQRTYRDYEDVIELFVIYLNGYGYQNLDGQDLEKWESRIEHDEDCFTKLFGIDQIDYFTFSEFFEYFIIRKVASGAHFMKLAVRVMKKWTNWLLENGYVDQDKHGELIDYFGEEKENVLPKVRELSDYIYGIARQDIDQEYDEIKEGYFTIVEIEQGKLWVEDSDQTIGPLIVTKQISDLCQKNWDLSLRIGKHQNKWYILESGNVYPHL